MALRARDSRHQKQINAGTKGRNDGHKFEFLLAEAINSCDISAIDFSQDMDGHLFCGNPGVLLLQYIAKSKNIIINKAHAMWLGGLATSGNGDEVRDEDGNLVKKCKSDILIDIESNRGPLRTGISVKTCSKRTPTNDQMYFTTATAFCELLETNGISVTTDAKQGMSKFCGDSGYRPIDILSKEELACRQSDLNRFYWEELSEKALMDWENIFDEHQDAISKLLFQKAYKSDPFPPDFLLHQTVKYDLFERCQTAIFTIDEIVQQSRLYSKYATVGYRIKKGTHKNDPNEHLAPRFGFIQFQRGGQKQHPTQLQFNLKAGYFNKLK